MTPDQIADLRRRRYNATVVAVRQAHSDLMVLRVRPDFPRPAAPGRASTARSASACGSRGFPAARRKCASRATKAEVVRRAYSLSCSVLDDDGRLLDLDATDWLEFYIVLVRETEDPAQAPGLTPRLFMLREGDRLQVGEKITGHFTLDAVKPADAVLFLSTGTGEAPHNYMLWELLKARAPRADPVGLLRPLPARPRLPGDPRGADRATFRTTPTCR